MTGKATRIELDAKQQALLERQLESGRYESANEVIDEALRLMGQRDEVLDDWLRGEVKAALADKRSPVPLNTVFARVEARHARRVKARMRGT